MTTHPTQFILDLADRMARGEQPTQEERSTLAELREMAPTLRNPIHVRCSAHPENRLIIGHGDHPDAGGGLFVRDGKWVCRGCGDGRAVTAEEIPVLDPLWKREERK
ncbi:MAG TPA: hypothetical protein VFL80_00935 [Thermoanaerobaculia bacterium]|nr:hypothetical protein [Thermoanaerobaculia bacterium]